MLKKFLSTALFLSSVLFYSSVAMAVSIGSFTGSLQGSVTDGAGVTQPFNGSVDATVNVSTAPNGSIIATVTGTAAGNTGLGIVVSFTATYDQATNNLTGTYTDAGSNTPTPLVFTNTGGLNWTTTISGTAPSANGPLPYTNLTLAISLPASAIYPGTTLPATQTFSGPIAAPVAVSVPIGAPVNQTVTLNPVLSGSWSATVVPQSTGTPAITGTVSGTLATATPTVITVFGQQIPVSISATFSGALHTNANGALEFQGSWVDANGNGGTMGFTIPVNANGPPTSFSVNISGGFPVNSPLGGTIPISFTATGTVPLTIL